jgi:MYXO-CTERM domain-containing protein
MLASRLSFAARLGAPFVLALVAGGAPRRAHATPLDPTAYPSLGALAVTSGTLTFDVDAATVSGAFSGTGKLVTTGGLPLTVFDFDTVNIGAGVTVVVTGSVHGLVILSRGDATIAGTIRVDGGTGGASASAVGAGVCGGGAGGTGAASPSVAGNAGIGVGGGGGGPSSMFDSMGGGGGFGGRGGSDGSLSGFGGPSYGDLLSMLAAGSGGGGGGGVMPSSSPPSPSGGGGGGAGGGAIEIGAAGNLTISGAISATGGSANYGTGGLAGGGSGGGILVHAGGTLTLTGTLKADGGSVANMASGGGGRVAVVVPHYSVGDLYGSMSAVAGTGYPPSYGVAGVLTVASPDVTIPSGKSLSLAPGASYVVAGQTGRTDVRQEVSLSKALTIQAGGTATAVGSNAFPSGAALTVSGSGVLNMGAFDQAIESIAGNGMIAATSSYLHVGAAGASSTFDGVISGAGGLEQAGPGTLTLTGPNTFGADARVTAGSLVVAGSLTANVDVLGGTLAGTGTVGGVTVASGAVHPGNPGSSGTLRAAALTCTTGAVQLDADAAGTSELAITNDVGLSGCSLYVNFAATPTVGSYRFLTYGGKLSGTFTSVGASRIGSLVVSASYANPGEIDLVVSEPSPDAGADAADASEVGMPDASMTDASPSEAGASDAVASGDTATGDGSMGSADAPLAPPPDATPAPVRVLVAECKYPTDCPSGFCVGGVCCDSACDGKCQSCTLPSAPGHCAPVPYGTDPRHSCGADGNCVSTCDGAGGCVAAAAGAECRVSHCTGLSTGVGPTYCSSYGAACSADGAQPFDCGAYACDPAFGVCLGTCTQSAQCASGYACDAASHTCVAGLTAQSGGCDVGGGETGRARWPWILVGLAALFLRRRALR